MILPCVIAVAIVVVEGQFTTAGFGGTGLGGIGSTVGRQAYQQRYLQEYLAARQQRTQLNALAKQSTFANFVNYSKWQNPQQLPIYYKVTRYDSLINAKNFENTTSDYAWISKIRLANNAKNFENTIFLIVQRIFEFRFIIINILFLAVLPHAPVLFQFLWFFCWPPSPTTPVSQSSVRRHDI